KKSITKTRKEELVEFTYESAEQSSACERNADMAERDVDDLWKVYLMKDKIGQEFDGTITQVRDFGFFVELDNTVEGFVKIESLPEDAYLYFEKTMMLKGQKFVFKLGDKVKVKLVSANLNTRKLDFEIL
ncbi:MAG: S1 RNA-binding domain-containing protein, partial [Muribaculaceae bacterium]|nr:S1 RNA-binding domain-containing protein [Muribaculaceae bacterium]